MASGAEEANSNEANVRVLAHVLAHILALVLAAPEPEPELESGSKQDNLQFVALQ